jgi:hypothetical protein
MTAVMLQGVSQQPVYTEAAVAVSITAVYGSVCRSDKCTPTMFEVPLLLLLLLQVSE